MPEFKIFHLNMAKGTEQGHPDWEAYWKASMGTVADAVSRGLYTHIATVEREDLADVFRRSNSIDEYWVNAPDSGVLDANARLRSTAVGDIVLDADGVFHSCQPCGWRPVEDVDGKLKDAIVETDAAPAL